MMSDRVSVEIDGPIAHVRMTRGDKRNGLDLPMFRALVEAGESLMDRAEVRAVVLSGEGPSFCAGLDFMSIMGAGLQEAMSELLGRTEDSPANLAQRVAWIWQEIEVPVIAALQGHVYGGGLQIALAADLRYAAPDARLSVMEIKWGLIPDMSITRTLPRLVGLDVAKELTWTGRVVEAQEAAALGLVTRITEDPLAAAFETARAIAARSPEAIRAGKQLWAAAPDLDDERGLALEEALQTPLLGSPNQMEAVMASMQRRPAVFRDPGAKE
ncbi:MAG: crotonase/enoyl-CoA hydratase family protein [Alphaproteobacteria bacterium]|nr:crotonase/enoyl-CoA hydratase family protein [Alphaproteobacteria bacterium]